MTEIYIFHFSILEPPLKLRIRKNICNNHYFLTLCQWITGKKCIHIHMCVCIYIYVCVCVCVCVCWERRKTLIKDSMLSNQKIFVNQLIISGISTQIKVLYNNSNLNKRPKIFTKNTYKLLNIHQMILYVILYECWRRKWQPTPVFLPGKFHRWRSLVGCSPWGR